MVRESTSYSLGQPAEHTMVSAIAEVVVEAIIGPALTPIEPGVDTAVVEEDPLLAD